MKRQDQQRFVFYISDDMRRQIEALVDKHGMTMARFGREALQSYLELKRIEKRKTELLETCKTFTDDVMVDS